MRVKKEDGHKELSNDLLNLSNNRISRIDFFYEITKLLLSYTAADAVELFINEENKYIHTRIASKTKYAFNYDIFPVDKMSKGDISVVNSMFPVYDYLIKEITRKDDKKVTGIVSTGGAILADNLNIDFAKEMLKLNPDRYYSTIHIASVLMVPLMFENGKPGLLSILSETSEKFNENTVKAFDEIASLLVIALMNHRNRSALNERMKELSCLYKLAQLAIDTIKPLAEFFTEIAELLPPAWQYPEIASARIVFDTQIFYTARYIEGWQRQSSDIIVNGINRGFVEVIYSQTKPKMDEGPFLAEERSLIDFFARQLSFIIERREAERERRKLNEQLRHTDRLAIIGQLAAGVAHELNEPLGSILGFAQLIGKTPGLTEDASQDLSKIIKASLYAREVIKKLLVFAREVPTHMEEVNLNTIIMDGLYFFEARCTKSHIEIIRSLAAGLPKIMGDDSQLNQVLINLVVNAIHAMPGGGKLMIQTDYGEDSVTLTVEDTGIGMPDEIRGKIFMPFFTTKDVNEGTGLGLAVVHGIVTAHNGEIKVESLQGKGTRFDIHFPSLKANSDR